MYTSRSLTVCQSLLPGGGLLWGGGVGVWSGGVCSQEGCLLQEGLLLEGGCLLWGGVSAPGGCLLPEGLFRGGVCSGGVVSQHALRQTSPPVDRQTPVKTLPWPNFVAAGKNRIIRALYYLLSKTKSVYFLQNLLGLICLIWRELWRNLFLYFNGLRTQKSFFRQLVFLPPESTSAIYHIKFTSYTICSTKLNKSVKRSKNISILSWKCFCRKTMILE